MITSKKIIELLIDIGRENDGISGEELLIKLNKRIKEFKDAGNTK